jgi:hypothetical protein
MAWRHAPFDKKNVAACIADVPFFISSNIRNLSLEFSKNRKKMFVTIHSSSFAD